MARLALAARDEHPGREQDHRRADHDQAGEQEQEHGFDGRLGAEEQGQVLQQRRADRQRVRGGREHAGQRGRDGGGAVQRVVQPPHLVRVHAAGVERELQLQRETGAAERALERAELVRVRDDTAGPEQRRTGGVLLERGLHRGGVLPPEGRSALAWPHDGGD
jgi:hypothetical protein